MDVGANQLSSPTHRHNDGRQQHGLRTQHHPRHLPYADAVVKVKAALSEQGFGVFRSVSEC